MTNPFALNADRFRFHPDSGILAALLANGGTRGPKRSGFQRYVGFQIYINSPSGKDWNCLDGDVALFNRVCQWAREGVHSICRCQFVSGGFGANGMEAVK